MCLHPLLLIKTLSNTPKHAFLDLNETFPIIIANDLNSDQETQVRDLLKENQGTLGWTLGE